MDSDKVLGEAESVINNSQIKTVKNKVSSNNNYIHDDLAFYILSKLLIKSLKRFGCVRKSWSILFQNSHFNTMFRNNFISNTYDDDDDDDSHHTFLLMHPDDDRIFENQLLLLPPDHTFQNTLKLNLPPTFQLDKPPCLAILGSTSVNGILCLMDYCPGGDLNKVRFVLWNPATHEFVVVPPSPDESGLPHPFGLSTRYNFHGFGYDKVTDDFKVIQYVSFDWDLRYENDNGIYRDPLFEIYSLTNNSWRILDIHMPDCLDFHYTSLIPTVYLDGMCHLLLDSRFEMFEMVVFSFDLSREVTFMTPFDKIFDGALFITNDFSIYKRRHLVVLNGSIALISDNNSDTTLQISILGQLGVKESWIKLFIIDPIPSFQWNLIGVGKKGYIFYRKKDGELAWLDLSTQIVEEIGFKGEENTCDIGIYKENLLSIRGLNN
ncbi:F-box protein CPR1-like [Trifolium pratense]|uniref:F-box protein CPR1-like n=1 Tax=Trifolium pratense TaxID=57577 RepID=UPI001E697DE0|nr:F-box protein CPR1-like [Trifolium pratense]